MNRRRLLLPLLLPPLRALAFLLLAGCTPHASDMRALGRMGAVFPPPGPTTVISFGSGPRYAPTQFGDADLSRAIPHLRPLRKLELGLGGTQVTDAGMNDVTQLKNLFTLTVARTPVTAAGLRALRSNPQLRTMYVSEGQVSSEDYVALRREMPHVQFRT